MACTQLAPSPLLDARYLSRIEEYEGFRRQSFDIEKPVEKCIPLVDGCESPSIFASVLKHLQEEEGKRTVIVLDCRFAYEFEGGHIKGAVPVTNPQEIQAFYELYESEGKDMVVVFYCEFSSQRAPKLYRFMRNLDRNKHMQTYPELSFPHMYVLHGGYKAYFEENPGLCFPEAYVKMSDPRFSTEAKASNTNLKRSWSENNQCLGKTSEPDWENRTGRLQRSKSLLLRRLDLE
eukprot:jgi/Mesen1/278/ME1152409C09492